MKSKFLEKVLELSKEGMSVLDVGAHVFKSSIVFRDAGLQVTALDIKPQTTCPEGIICVTADFMSWAPDKKYDILYLRNSMQFMPKKELLAKLGNMGARIIAIETFYGPPEPPFERQHLMTYYEPEDFRFEGYQTVLSEKMEHEGSDLSGNPRRFKLVKYIGVKN